MTIKGMRVPGVSILIVLLLAVALIVTLASSAGLNFNSFINKAAPISYTATENLAIQKTNQAISAFLAKNDIGNIADSHGQTINKIYAQTNIGYEQKTQKAIELICGKMPSIPSSPTFSQANALGSWRFCAAVTGYELAAYHQYKNQNTYMAADIYQSIFQIDSLVATSHRTPLNGLGGWQYRLGNYGWRLTAMSYINDAGMGMFSGFGWFKSMGKVPQYYCTQLERPYTSGRNCKNINLYTRIAQVANRVLRTTDNYRDFRSDDHFLAWNSAGRAVESVINGNVNERFQRILEANDYISTEQNALADPSASTVLPWSNLGLAYSDTYQHLQVMLNIDNYKLPDEVKAKAKKFYDNYVALFFNSRYQISDITHNSYRPTAVRSLWGSNKVLSYCNSDNTKFHTKPGSSTTTWVRGEHLNDALMTIGPVLYNYLKLSNQGTSANNVIQKTISSLSSIISKPIDWRDETCVTSSMYAGDSPDKNQLKIALREFGYLYFTLNSFKKTPVSTYGSVNNTPPPMQSVDYFTIGNVLYQSFWRGGVGYVRTVPVVNGAPDYAHADHWSKPITVSGIPGTGTVQAQANVIDGNRLLQVFWRNNVGYTRYVPYNGTTVLWNQASGWSSVPASNYPGSGNFQTYSLIYNKDGSLMESFWRNNQGYARTIPAGVPFYLCRSVSTCKPIIGPLNLNSFPGSGSIQAQADYRVGNTLYQTYWRGGAQYYRTTPVVNGVSQWSRASAWVGPIWPAGFMR